MESAEAVAKVEEWLRAVHGPNVSAPGGAGLRVNHEKVLRIPEAVALPLLGGPHLGPFSLEFRTSRSVVGGGPQSRYCRRHLGG